MEPHLRVPMLINSKGVLQTKSLQDCNVNGTEWETLEQGDSLTIRLVMRLMRSPYLSCMVARDSESKAWDWSLDNATHMIRILPPEPIN